MDFLHKGTADTMSETKGRFLSGKLLSQLHVHILTVSGDPQQYFSLVKIQKGCSELTLLQSTLSLFYGSGNSEEKF